MSEIRLDDMLIQSTVLVVLNNARPGHRRMNEKHAAQIVLALIKHAQVKA